MSSDPDLSSWPTKAEAAAALHCSVRVLERRIQAGEIEVRPRRRPGARRELVCNPHDVDSLRPPAFAMPAAEVQGADAADFAGHTAERLHQQQLIAAAPPSLPAIAAWLTEALHAKQSTATEPDAKPWLTIDEAARLSGLSQNFLKRECHSGALKAVRDQRAWKIQRTSLLSFDGTTPATKS